MSGSDGAAHRLVLGFEREWREIRRQILDSGGHPEDDWETCLLLLYLCLFVSAKRPAFQEEFVRLTFAMGGNQPPQLSEQEIAEYIDGALGGEERGRFGLFGRESLGQRALRGFRETYAALEEDAESFAGAAIGEQGVALTLFHQTVVADYLLVALYSEKFHAQLLAGENDYWVGFDRQLMSDEEVDITALEILGLRS